MAAGDTTNPSRVRVESNERLDLVDQDRLSQGPRTFDDAVTRALLFSPRATAALPVGLVFTGGTLVANPTAPSDGKVRVPSDLCVALDSDDRAIVKITGTTLDATIPAGGSQYQVYLYWLEIPGDQAKRRAIPVSSPFTEFTIAPNTSYKSNAGIYVRLGGSGSVVPSDVVNGITTNLVLLGIASNTAGVVTINSQTSNRLSTVVPPTTLPANSTDSGTVRTLHDLAGAGLYEAARAKFLEPGALSGAAASIVAGAGAGSDRRISGLSGITSTMVGSLIKISGATTTANNGYFKIKVFVNATTVDVYNPSGVIGDASNGAIVWALVNHVLPVVGAAPSAVNNYGAYVEPRRGLDSVDRSTFVLTIGDGVSTFGSLDRTQFLNDNDLLQAAFNITASNGGGQIVLKDSVNLSITTSFVVSYGVSFTLTSTSAGVIVFSGSTTITFSSGSISFANLNFDITGSAFIFRNSAVVSFSNCVFSHGSGSGTATALVGDASSVLKSFRMSDCSWNSSASGADAPTSPIVLYVTTGTNTTSVVVERTDFKFVGSARGLVRLDNSNNRSFIQVDTCNFIKQTGASSYAIAPYFIFLSNNTALNTTKISNCNFVGGTSGGVCDFVGVDLFNSIHAIVDSCFFSYTKAGVRVVGQTGPDFDVQHCHIVNSVFNSDGSSSVGEGIELRGNIFSNFLVSNCDFSNTFGVRLTFGGTLLIDVMVTGCAFSSGLNQLQNPSFLGDLSTGNVQLVWTNNRHFGYFDLSNQDRSFALFVQGAKVRALISGNKFSQMQNGVFVGSIPSGASCDLIRINSPNQGWTVTGNFVGDSGSMAPGLALYLLHATSSGQFTIENGVFSGNTIGDSASKVGFIKIGDEVLSGRAVISSLDATGNSFSSTHNNGSIDHTISIFMSASTTSSLVVIASNSFNHLSGDSNWFRVTGLITSFTFTGNSLIKIPTSTISGTIPTALNVMLSNNIASLINDGTTTPVINVACATPTNFNGNGTGSFPGSASPYPNNININRT